MDDRERADRLEALVDRLADRCADLSVELNSTRRERDQARRWAATWKRAARVNRSKEDRDALR